MKKLCLHLCLLLPTVGIASAQSAPNIQDPPDTERSAAEIRACSRANLPEKTMVQALEFTIGETGGRTRNIQANIFLKRIKDDETRGTLQVSQPADVRGVSYLWVDGAKSDRLFLYLPSVQRVRRITGEMAANSLLGSDVSYADVKHLSGVSAGGDARQLEAGEIAQRPVYRLELSPAPAEDRIYQRVLFHVDQATCVPLQIEFFADDETPRKRLTADVDSLHQIGPRWLARRMTMRDLDKGSETSMTITGVEFDENVNNRIFNQRGFHFSAAAPETDFETATTATPQSPENQ